MEKSSLRVVTAYLFGLADAGVDLNGGITISPMVKPQLSALFQSAVLEDENHSGADADPFERGGMWHLAVNRVIYALEEECRRMTYHFDYSQGLGMGDGAFRSFMEAIRAFHLQPPAGNAQA